MCVCVYVEVYVLCVCMCVYCVCVCACVCVCVCVCVCACVCVCVEGWEQENTSTRIKGSFGSTLQHPLVMTCVNSNITFFFLEQLSLLS